MPGKMGKGYRSRQVQGSEPKEDRWKTKGEYHCRDGHEETAAGERKRGLTFDHPGPDLYQEGRMPEQHTSKDH